MTAFTLPDSFIEEFAHKEPEWGPVGYVTYKRTYARPLDACLPRIQELSAKYGVKESEEWWLTCIRVVEGTYTIQKKYCLENNRPWNEEKAVYSARSMYRLMFNFKFLPPGRGLWSMGTSIIDKIGGAAANNCGFCSTAHLEDAEPFCFLMDMSMLGVGIGFDTKGSGCLIIKSPVRSTDVYVVPDTREGWVESVRQHLNAYLKPDCKIPIFDYSYIRPLGSPIKSFGGTASGPGPLVQLHSDIDEILGSLVSKPITTTAIVDVMNTIGRCVVSGNVRRSAEIAFGESDDLEFMKLKDPERNQSRLDRWGWASNNSVFVKQGQDYTLLAESTAANGEPGYMWLSNAQEYGRMSDDKNYADMDAVGGNPCQPKWATVLTPEGVSTIGDIGIGSIIWSGKQWTKVINKWSTGVKPVNAYRTTSGVFYGTENHKIIQQGQKVEVKDAESIDLAVGPNIEPFKLNPRIIVDGLVLGDGGVHKASNNLVILYVGSKDVDYHNSEISYLIRDKREGISPYAYEISTSILPEELPETYNRKIPNRYRFGKNEDVCAFLRGLYTANGSVVGNRVTLKAASFNVIEQVQEMLSSVGISSYYTTNKPQSVTFSNGTYVCKQSYDLNIDTYAGRCKFRKLIGFIHSYKMDKLNEICENESNRALKYSYDIVGIEHISTEEVFDLTVDADEHTYWTGGVLVSNCLEQTLENIELCCLVESFPSRHDSYYEFQRTLKYAYLYAKTITLLDTHNAGTNEVIHRNRRIGCSLTGITDAVSKLGKREFFNWCDKGYSYIRALDDRYSSWFNVNRSKKMTSVKPSGTVSLLPQVSPGIHFPYSEYYYRVIRFSSDSPFVRSALAANYKCYDLNNELNTTAVYFPVHVKNFTKAAKDVSMWEQLELAAALQYYWADNQVSVTVSFKPEEAKDIKSALEYYESRLKSVSFLPYKEHGYSHAPYQPITKEEYEEYSASLKPVDWKTTHEVTEQFCDGDRCIVA